MTALVKDITRQEVYTPQTAAIFFRSREQNGILSNMTGRMPLTVNDMKFQSSEGLFQAFKYPGQPEIQERIGSISSGLFAKNVAYSKTYREYFDPEWWNEVRMDATIAILAIKLQQHPKKFGDALRATGNLPIVKRTPTTDNYWGAILQDDGTIQGGNALGKLLTKLRDMLVEWDDAQEAAKDFASYMVFPEELVVNGQEIRI